MRTIAILAPPMDGISPDRYERARMAMLEQMMLLARGLPVTHPAVRAAAELVGSAIAADPMEFALAAAGRAPASAAPAARVEVPAPAVPASTVPAEAPAPVAANPAYGRYLSTILGTQPPSRRTAAVG